MSLTERQLEILRHALGINNRRMRDPESGRNHYATEPGDPELVELERLGMVEKYCGPNDYCDYDWYRCTAAGIEEARRSFYLRRDDAAKRRYQKFLELSDVYPDLTFREFLTSEEFRDVRENA